MSEASGNWAHTDRRRFLQLASAAGVTAFSGAAFGSEKVATSASQNKANEPVKFGAGLEQPSFLLLPLGAIRPTGWLRRQLEVQAQGLSGHLDETWPDVGPESGWLGGKGESWE